MANTINLFLSFFALLVIQQANAFKCWKCTSATTGSGYCGDNFDDTGLNLNQRKWAYVECTAPVIPGLDSFGPAMRPVCKKQKQIIDDVVVYTRSCAFEDVKANADECANIFSPPNVKNESCEKCYTDGCNGKPMNKVAKKI